MPANKWNTEENEFLMKHAYKIPWSEIAAAVGRTEGACKAHFEKIKRLRQMTKHWKGI